jgi:hypothetical protein
MSARPIALALLAIALSSGPALAQSACFKRDILVSTLSTKYSEAPTGGGMQNQSQLIEVWTSPKSGSFTIFVTQANGVSCVVATGKHWQSMTPVREEGVAG